MSNFVLDARTATPHYPGIGRYVASLAAAMAPQLDPREQLTLLVDPHQPLSIAGTRTVPVATSPFSLAQQWTIPARLRELGAAIYHSPYYLMPYRPGVPALLTVYDLIPLRHPEHSSPRARLLFSRATRLALRAARHVVAITETARRDFMAEFGLSPARITAIPLAADPTFQPQGAQAVAALREKYGLPERFALYVGSNKPHKNLVGLVAAWGGMTETDSGLPSRPTRSQANRRLARPRRSGGRHDGGLGDAELVIAGAWDDRYPEARQLAGSLEVPRIRWLGPIPQADLPSLYSAATVFVFPSLFEGFGLPVIEAMACGTPVVCSNVTSLPEVAGDAAILFDPAPVGGEASHPPTAPLRSALARVLDDEALRAELREKGLARAAQFSWQHTAARTLEFYRRFAAQGPDGNP